MKNIQKIQFGVPQPTTTVNRLRGEIPSGFGSGHYTIDQFNSGLSLVILQTALHKPGKALNMVTKPIVGLGFCLAGEFGVSSNNSKSPFTIKAGQTGFFTFPQHSEITELLPSSSMYRVYLMLEGEILSSFAQGDEDNFSPVLKSLDKQQSKRMMHTITPLMRAVLHQILYCPYCGKARHLYLESKAMELLAHKLAQIHPSANIPDKNIKRADYEGILHAAEILVNNLDDPPDTKQLARSVGLSRSKLHRCFRKVYGVSPFEYLRNHRLQTAMQLLQSGEINVTEAAFHVGYSNLSHFSKAFKAMFGITPKELSQKSSPYQCTF